MYVYLYIYIWGKYIKYTFKFFLILINIFFMYTKLCKFISVLHYIDFLRTIQSILILRLYVHSYMVYKGKSKIRKTDRFNIPS